MLKNSQKKSLLLRRYAHTHIFCDQHNAIFYLGSYIKATIQPHSGCSDQLCMNKVSWHS